MHRKLIAGQEAHLEPRGMDQSTASVALRGARGMQIRHRTSRFCSTARGVSAAAFRPIAKFGLLLLWGGCACMGVSDVAKTRTTEPFQAVTTTSLIETALRDLLGEHCDVVRLLPAGSCPGHFDIEPAHVKALAQADVFVRHDFQVGMDPAVWRAGLCAERCWSVTSLPAFTIPSNYVALCRELGDKIAMKRPDLAEIVAARRAQIEDKATRASEQALARLEPIRGRRILAAHYQRNFCEWAGLLVVAVFHAGTDESAWQLNRAVDMAQTAGAEAVIGNLQWGRKHLRALREATGLPGALLSNFPNDGQEGAYWRLLDANVSALIGIWNHGAGN